MVKLAIADDPDASDEAGLDLLKPWMQQAARDGKYSAEQTRVLIRQRKEALRAMKDQWVRDRLEELSSANRNSIALYAGQVIILRGYRGTY